MKRPYSVQLAVLACMLGCVLVLRPGVARGESIEAKLPSGQLATAAFHAGEARRPAVLVLHGFLQTNAFPTIESIVSAATTAGYTVLAPNLSLGISRRNRSLPCEAIHLHTLRDDEAEVGFWVRWLTQRGYDRVVLVGHSFGNVQLLGYLQGRPAPSVKKVVLISLTDVEVKQDARQRARLAQTLRERVEKRDTRLVEAEYGHCRKYVSPPAALLTYLAPSRRSILDAVTKSPVPAVAIMGGEDERMGPDWLDRLASAGIDVRVVPGASHFFDNQYEFDLQEAVLQALPAR